MTNKAQRGSLQIGQFWLLAWKIATRFSRQEAQTDQVEDSLQELLTIAAMSQRPAGS
jgi:hypothetical protein